MSKYLKVPNGDYKLSVQDGGEITLDTGNGYGTVVITGDLRVQGGTTTVRSEDLTIKDNIIVLNKDETGNGISLNSGTAGIRIDRGNYTDVQFLFDETQSWNDPVTETIKQGLFKFIDINNSSIGIQTNSISTQGGDLYLINTGNGVISVSGTNDYERKIFVYAESAPGANDWANTGISQSDDDRIPNTRAVIDYVSFVLANTFQSSISSGVDSPTYVETLDIDITGDPSVINFAVHDTIVAKFYGDRYELGNVTLTNSTLTSTVPGQDLAFSASGTGVVKIDDVLELTTAGVAPTQPASGIRLYASSQSTGNTGLYFVNSNSNTDELISKNRSLLFSMIF